MATTLLPPSTDAPPHGSPRRIKEPRGDRMLNVVLLVLLTLFALTIVYPFIFIVSASLSDPVAVSRGEMWLWPVEASLAAYEALLDYPEIPRGFLNSLLYSGTAMLLAGPDLENVRLLAA